MASIGDRDPALSYLIFCVMARLSPSSSPMNGDFEHEEKPKWILLLLLLSSKYDNNWTGYKTGAKGNFTNDVNKFTENSKYVGTVRENGKTQNFQTQSKFNICLLCIFVSSVLFPPLILFYSFYL